MTIPEKAANESVLDYAVRLSEWHSGIHKTEIRKAKGQFFTPKKVAGYMAGLFELGKNDLRVLDPGAGTGVLTAALCTRILNEKKGAVLTIDVFENDREVLPVLRKVLDACKAEFEKKGRSLKVSIYEQDFVSHNLKYLHGNTLYPDEKIELGYDLVISNPPYSKLKKNTLNANLERILAPHPNIYTVFMALSLCMLKKNGELVFITPRSFCSGAYYKTFRKWFVKNSRLRNIHIFESRKDVFDSDEVLQENIILRANKSEGLLEGAISISTSKNKEFEEFTCFDAKCQDIIYQKNGGIFIRIPTSPRDIEILRLVDSWPNTLHNLGLEISTGPVVAFRAREYQFPELQKEPHTVPLLWMHNLQGANVVWPIRKKGKAQAILASKETESLLLKVRNLVLLKRFSSKEQKRRLYAAVLTEDKFPFKLVGLENHLNYIYQLKGGMPQDLVFGMATLLNSEIADRYFRCLNGNTQVNASDIRTLPLPSKERIMAIGAGVFDALSNQKEFELDSVVNTTLQVRMPAIAVSN